MVIKVDIIFLIKIDYFVIFLEFEEIELSGRGVGFWKLNIFLLVNENYKYMIINNLLIWLDVGKDIYDFRFLWDWIKFNIRLNFIIFFK